MADKLGFEELRSKYKDILSKAFSTNNIDLLDSFSRNTNDVDRKAAMDQAFRDKLLELLVENPDILENYVSFCIESCRRQMVTPTMPVVLLGDIFDALTNPNTCYNKIQWKTFVAHSGSVLSAFSSYKLEAIELQKSKLNRLKTVNADIEMQESNKEQHYFAKFLTNQKLLELQLSDSNFRRCVLIQFLILFQYLTSAVKFKMETQELKSDQTDWVKETTALVYRLLSETPPDGKNFAECVKCILRREEYWNSWKNDGCPEFQKPKPPVTVDSNEEVKKTRKRRRPVGDIIKEYEGQEKFYMGNNELTKLWNLCPDNLVACRTKERDFMPSLESYMVCGAGGGARRTSSGGWGWRALRLLARRSPHFFVHTNNPIGRLPDYLDDMVKRVTREMAANAANANSANGEASNNHSDKTNKQDQVEEEITEEQMEADLIKGADTNDIEQVPDSTHGEEEKPARARVTMISAPQLAAVAAKLDDWKRLATKLGYKPDEVQFFETESATDAARASSMLRLWFDDDEDASVESLLYIMEGLKMLDACEALKAAK
ncbi:unnamed protein product, partial [Iphiclides podalirius]